MRNLFSSSEIESLRRCTRPFGPVGAITFQRTYAHTKADGKLEDWADCTARCISGVFSLLKERRSESVYNALLPRAHRMAYNMARGVWSPPGRGLEMLGTALVHERQNGAPLNNCGAVSTRAHLPDAMAWLCRMGMSGVGVGFDTAGAGLAIRPIRSRGQWTYVVDDSREGWADCIRVTVFAAIGYGDVPTTYDFSHVRPRGARLSSFSKGHASGPGVLMEAVVAILSRMQGLRPGKDIVSYAPPGGSEGWRITVDISDGGKHKPCVEAADIVFMANMIGRATVAGGTRRAAQLALHNPRDNMDFVAFASLKRDENMSPLTKDRLPGESDEAFLNRPGYPRCSWVSNNSWNISGDVDEAALQEAVVAGYGDLGFFWERNARGNLRMGDAAPAGDRDDTRLLPNPCGEQQLHSMELCNVVETYPAHCETVADFREALSDALLYAKIISLVETGDYTTDSVLRANRRIGISQTGIQQALVKFGERSYYGDMCRRGYDMLRAKDEDLSAILGVAPSVRLTTVKPSGSTSKLWGTTCGVNFAPSEYYIQRIRFAESSPIVRRAEELGYTVLALRNEPNTVAIEIPVREQMFLRGESDVTVWEQLDTVAKMQRHWSDNMVSSTIKYRHAEELPEVIHKASKMLKSVSFNPIATPEAMAAYEAPPWEPITAEEYARRVRPPLSFEPIDDAHDSSSMGCDGVACEVVQ